MAGYDGFSMSNNARDAYENGIKPKSKWSRKDSVILAKMFKTDKELRSFISTIPTDGLEYHHTSKKYNITFFYSEEVIVQHYLEEVEADCDFDEVKDLLIFNDFENWGDLFALRKNRFKCSLFVGKDTIHYKFRRKVHRFQDQHGYVYLKRYGYWEAGKGCLKYKMNIN